MKLILRSPILHLIVLGIAAFAAYTYLKPPDREEIRVTAQTIDALVQQRESITQNPVTSEAREEIIEGHIEDEILLREAYKRGFDKNDYRVRKRLLGVMRSSLSEVIPEPTIGQLRAYYEANKERYLTGPSRSFEQVYFSFDSKILPKVPAQFLQTLNSASDLSKLGDFALGQGNRYTRSSFEYLAGNFGKPFAQAVLDLPLNQWRGPIESFRGIHYVRVIGEHGSELPPFEQMESYLRTEYMFQKARESQVSKIEEMRKGYEVVVEAE